MQAFVCDFLQIPGRPQEYIQFHTCGRMQQPVKMRQNMSLELWEGSAPCSAAYLLRRDAAQKLLKQYFPIHNHNRIDDQTSGLRSLKSGQVVPSAVEKSHSITL